MAANVSYFSNITNLAGVVGPHTFQGQCLNKLGDATNNYTDWRNITLTNQDGEVMYGFGDYAWGITYSTCVAHCTLYRDISFPWDFNVFANAMTNYLLPWFTLTAQLPFETGNAGDNTMAFFMALGSPVLIAYSLTLTILNRSWARTYFAKLKRDSTKPTVSLNAPDFGKRVDSASYLVQEAQQVPLRCNQEDNWLASLIVLPQNVEWWVQLRKRLDDTRRGFSASLAAQMSLALIAWGLTVGAGFAAAIGDPTTALQIASSSLWIWLAPVILGWIFVGSQTTHHSIDDSLRSSAFMARKRPEPPIGQTAAIAQPNEPQPAVTYVKQGLQQGIEQRSGLSPQIQIFSPSSTINASGPTNGSANGTTLNRQSNPIANVAAVNGAANGSANGTVANGVGVSVKKYSIGNWLGFSIGGDEETKGPTYNYARVFTWFQVAITIGTALETTLERLEKNQPCEDERQTGDATHDEDGANGPMKFHAFSTAISKYCGLSDVGSCKQYPEWNEIPADLVKRMFVAAGVALLIQWGTAGASIMIAYLTPAKGLGCSSGSYVVYASVGTLAWFFLLLGSLFSQQAMLLYQRRAISHSISSWRQPSFSTLVRDREIPRSLGLDGICAAAVIFRLLGKQLCILNTFWLLATSIMEFIGAFDNCWCMSNYPSSAGSGSVVLFKTATDLSRAAGLPWGMGVMMIFITVLAGGVFFAVKCNGR